MNKTKKNLDLHNERRTDYEFLLKELGVDLPLDLLKIALTHRSYAFENECEPNERIEFLGDAVLQIVVTEHLYKECPTSSEGNLAPMRAATVSQRPLSQVARRLDLGAFILLGKGEILTKGWEKDSLLCDTMEAIFGAVYLTHGFSVATEVILQIVKPELSLAKQGGARLDWKSSIQELLTKLIPGEVPVYTASYTGPDHARHFTVEVRAGSIAVAVGEGTSKRAAEIQAAKRAYEAIYEVYEAQICQNCPK